MPDNGMTFGQISAKVAAMQTADNKLYAEQHATKDELQMMTAMNAGALQQRIRMAGMARDATDIPGSGGKTA